MKRALAILALLASASAPAADRDLGALALGSELEASDRVVFAVIQGTNVLDVVTNYDSQVNIPERYLVQIDTNGSRRVIWRESTMLTNEIAKAIAANNAETDAKLNTKADKAWSHHTSGLGAEAPENTTWISTPTTVIAGGFEFEKVATTAGALWILTSNGMVAQTNQFGFFDLSATDGTSVFRIEKTDSYLVGANADGITRSGNTVTVPVGVVSADHPYLRYAAGLESPVTWYREEDENIPASISYSWSGSSGAWVCTITAAATKGFFAFEFLQQGETKIINNGVTDLSAGIHYNGHKYMPAANGNKLEFIRQ